MKTKLIKVGFWKEGNLLSDLLSDYPDPHDFVDPDWAPGERKIVIAYLDAGRRDAQYMGYSWCRFRCGARGTAMGTADLSDGVYVWPEGFAHYLRAHQVRPPQEFVRYVLGLEGS